ncbi:DNA/RNA polymerases superfamily protein [Gossypium australe]|uniref:DNA/RNA polymerases superfamily protein n=1 Tax=Gossypium australe TaxID=47621 RepID=A0A5B6VQM7_9ROSI|nr:DNA/RNA polymerases superfamily protein [Gossypium australe]
MGRFSLFDTCIYTLIDIGFTHSYICDKFVVERSFRVVSNESIVVNRMVKDCSLSFGGQDFLADLMLLSIHEFDDIWGLGWLTRHNAMVEYKSRGVWLVSADGNKVFVLRVERDMRNSLVYTI